MTMTTPLRIICVLMLMCPTLWLSTGDARAQVTPRRDAVVYANVERALAVAEDVDNYQIAIDVDRGRVTLSGIVRSMTEKRRAEALARDAEGVLEVVNRLEVRPDAEGTTVYEQPPESMAQ